MRDHKLQIQCGQITDTERIRHAVQTRTETTEHPRQRTTTLLIGVCVEGPQGTPIEHTSDANTTSKVDGARPDDDTRRLHAGHEPTKKRPRRRRPKKKEGKDTTTADGETVNGRRQNQNHLLHPRGGRPRARREFDRFNDPSAGSPTETLLRLLLPLGGRV